MKGKYKCKGNHYLKASLTWEIWWGIHPQSYSETKTVRKKRKQMRLNSADFDFVRGNNHWLSNQPLPEQHKSTGLCWHIFSSSLSLPLSFVPASLTLRTGIVVQAHEYHTYTNFIQIAISCYIPKRSKRRHTQKDKYKYVFLFFFLCYFCAKLACFFLTLYFCLFIL